MSRLAFGCRRRTIRTSTAKNRVSNSNRHMPFDTGRIGSNGRKRREPPEAAVVVTVTVSVVAELASVTWLGETVQLASEGAPVHVNVNDPDIPPSPLVLSV